jgi:hypothetical protein
MAYRITDAQKDISILNDALQQLDQIQRNLTQLQKTNNQTQTQLAIVANARGVSATNNIVFTWNHTALTLSWPAAYARDSNNVYYPIVAGVSTPLLANTEYWAGWNPTQQSMSFQTSVDSLVSLPHEVILCNIKTGSTGTSGVAGGGGSTPGLDDVSGFRYTLL